MPHRNGAQLIGRQDIFPKTPGFQPTRQGRRGTPGGLTKWPSGHPALFVLDLNNPQLGWQLTADGTTPRNIPRGVPIGRSSVDGGGVFRVPRRRGRKINPANSKAMFAAVDRLDAGVKWAKTMFRAEDKISKRVKRRPKKRKRR